jgi:hypothetical protein
VSLICAIFAVSSARASYRTIIETPHCDAGAGTSFLRDGIASRVVRGPQAFGDFSSARAAMLCAVHQLQLCGSCSCAAPNAETAPALLNQTISVFSAPRQ